MSLIFRLAFRQLTQRRRFAAVALLCVIPVGIAGLYAIAGSGRPSEDGFFDGLMGLYITAVLPIVAVVLSSAAFGDELEDRTLVYLATKPIARWRIAVPKALAALAAAAMPLLPSATVAALLITGEPRDAATAMGALLAGAAGYVAIFTWAGLAIRHALAFGLVYVFLWEATLSGLFPGLRLLSIREYTYAILNGLDEARPPAADADLSLSSALVATAVVIALFTWLAARRLARMDVP